MAIQEIEPTFANTHESNHSAPNYGADFSNPIPFPEFPNFVISDTFPRLTNGLVDPEVYLPYLVDDPMDIPPIVIEDDARWIHQHMYFWRGFYEQRDTDAKYRDKLLCEFRKAPYNQLLMRKSEELKVHDRYRNLVSPPPIKTMRKSMMDFENLDILAAAAMGRRLSLVPEIQESLAPKKRRSRQAKLYSPAEIASYFDGEVEKALDKLNNPLVTPHRVITGAISRMGRMINSERLLEEAERRIEADPIYFPVRIRTIEHIQKTSNQLLKKMPLVKIVKNSPR